MELNEAKTRALLINPILVAAGWKLHDRSLVRFEIPVDGYDAEPWNGVTDYCLYDHAGNVLAVVEARLKPELQPADAARAAREKAEAELAELQSRITPLQTEINQLTRQFWVSKDQVKANKYDLSASRYRQVEQDEEFYEQPRVTLERLAKLEATAADEVAALKEMLGKL